MTLLYRLYRSNARAERCKTMGSEKSQFDRMMEVARERLARHAPEELAQRAGVEYADGAFIVSTLGKRCGGACRSAW